MNFLLPAAAWGLLGALPIIAFYLLKTRLPRRRVSTNLFWQQLSPQLHHTPWWRKLRRLLSLLLQLGFLAALVLALLQPMAAWQAQEPAALVLVLDPSASMEATDVAPSRWAQAVAGATQRIQSMRAFDEATLLLATDPPRVLCPWTRSKNTLREALASAAPVPTGTDPRPALALGQQLLAGRVHGRLTLWSDAAWAEPPAPETLAPVEQVRLNAAGQNTGLTLFAVRRAFTGPGEFQLLARVEATATTTAQLEILRNGRTMDVQSLTLTPGTPWEKTWPGRAEEATEFQARLTGLTHDSLARDNQATAALAAQPPLQVVLVAPPNGFLDAALQSLTTVKWQRQWPAESLGAPQPGTLYVFYRAVPPAEFPAAAAVLIDPAASGFWGTLQGPITQPMVSDFQRTSPLLRFAGLENVNLQAARAFTPAPGAEVLAESFGQPLIFAHWRGERRWLVLPFDLEKSDLVLRTAFPILLGNLVESLRPEAAPTAGEPLPGSIETALRATAPEPTATPSAASLPSIAWWQGYPLWWWAIGFGVLWLLGEWWSYTRRLTE